MPQHRTPMLNLDAHVLIHALAGRVNPGECGLDSPEFARALSAIHVWPLDLAVCRQIRALDFRSDPADEIIAATSLVHRVPLLTRDRRMRRSKLVPLA